MPGAVNLDANTIRPVSAIAYKDRQGKWRAGPDAVGKYVDAAGNVDPAYADQATSLRRNANMIKNIMREADEGEGVSEAEARDRAQEILGRLREAETEEDRREIWRDIVGY